jgi:hypothetical protein
MFLNAAARLLIAGVLLSTAADASAMSSAASR